MIKCDKVETIIKGDKATILTELSIIIDAIKRALEKNGDEGAEKTIHRAVEMAFWDEKKIKEETAKLRREVIKDILEIMLDDMEDDNDDK